MILQDLGSSSSRMRSIGRREIRYVCRMVYKRKVNDESGEDSPIGNGDTPVSDSFFLRAEMAREGLCFVQAPFLPISFNQLEQTSTTGRSANFSFKIALGRACTFNFKASHESRIRFARCSWNFNWQGRLTRHFVCPALKINQIISSMR